MKATKIICEIITTHEYDDNGVNEIAAELHSMYGGNLNIASVTTTSETIELGDPENMHEGIYLALDGRDPAMDNKECPCCGADLRIPLALTLDVPDNQLGRVRASLLPDNTISVGADDQHYLDGKRMEDICCLICKESLVSFVYNFQYNDDNREPVVANLVKMIETKGF